MQATTRALSDVDELAGLIDEQLLHDARQRLEAQLLAGSGTPPNLRGLDNITGVQAQPKGADSVPLALAKGVRAGDRGRLRTERRADASRRLGRRNRPAAHRGRHAGRCARGARHQVGQRCGREGLHRRRAAGGSLAALNRRLRQSHPLRLPGTQPRRRAGRAEGSGGRLGPAAFARVTGL